MSAFTLAQLRLLGDRKTHETENSSKSHTIYSSNCTELWELLPDVLYLSMYPGSLALPAHHIDLVCVLADVQGSLK